MNIATLLDMTAQASGDRVMIGRLSDGITAERWHELSRGGAEAIELANARALIYLDIYGPAFPVAMFAAARAGIPLIPINFRLSELQLSELLSNHPNSLVIAGGRWTELLHKLGLNGISADQWLEKAAQFASKDFSTVPPHSAPAICVYTSGSTSSPKCVNLYHQNLSSYIFGAVDFDSCSSDEATLVSVPPYHIAGIANVLTNLFAGRRIVPLVPFSPTSWLSTVRDERISHALVVPTMLAQIMELPEPELRVPSLQTLAYGGSKMPLKLIERALEKWPNVEFVNAYGLTETSSTITMLGPEDHRLAFSSDDPEVRKRLSSVGKPLPRISVEIRDDSGGDVPTGESGTVWVRGDQVSGDYEGRGSTLDADGFFDTRDKGHFDQDGYLFIEGRTDDVIIRGGENVAAADIEDALLSHPDVLDAVAIGVPDEEWGERIEAVIVPRNYEAIDTEHIREHVRGLLRGSKTPDRILCWSEIPRTETGKLIRREIRQTVIDSNSGSN